MEHVNLLNFTQFIRFLKLYELESNMCFLVLK